MKTEEYDSLPEVLSLEQIAQLTSAVLEDSQAETIDVTLKKLKILGERQWHIYELQPPSLRSRLEWWIIDKWTGQSESFLESIVVLCYEYGLRKDIVEKALETYRGQHREEFRKDYENSSGMGMDPWWSLRKTPNQALQPTVRSVTVCAEHSPRHPAPR